MTHWYSSSAGPSRVPHQEVGGQRAEGGGWTTKGKGKRRTADRRKFLLLFSNTQKNLTLWLNSGSPTRTQRQFGRQLFQNPESIQDQIGNPIQEQFRDPIQKRIRNPIPNQIHIPPIQDPIQEQIGNPIEDQFQELNPTDGEDGSYSYSNPGGFTNFRLVWFF